MPSSIDAARTALVSVEEALVEKIEELSFLRQLNDRLARAADFASACRALVDFVWEERRPGAVAYLSVDLERRVCRVEAIAPSPGDLAGAEVALDRSPLPRLLADREPVIVGEVPAWLTPGDGSGGVIVSAPTEVRARVTGLVILSYTGAGAARLEEDRRLLAIVATSAALALDVARSQAREEFLATLRHDINNPITVAFGNMELLADRLKASGDEVGRRLADTVLESLEAVADLVSNYLHLAAIDQGMASLELEPVDLGGLAADVVARFEASAAEKGIAMSYEGAPLVVRADRRQLGRVVTNLVSNAVKYTPGPGRVDVRVAADEAGVVMTVADTGYGLAPADLARLFTKYGRFHRNREIPGTGLGLYISKAIVEAHAGTIEAASAPGEGATFTVRLTRRA